MADEEGQRAYRAIPEDLLVVLVLTALSLGTVFLPGLRETPLQFVFGLLFVTFLPGYATVSAVFPERPDSESDRSDARSNEEQNRTSSRSSASNQSIDGLERVALSVGLSSIIVVLLGLVLNYTPVGIRLFPMAILLTIITITMTAIAVIRRQRLPPRDRFHAPIWGWLGGVYAAIADPDSRTDALLNAVIIIAIVVAASSLIYAAAVPSNGERYTELYLLAEDDGELVADDYPRELTSGEDHPLVVGLSNHELETVEYSIVVELQQVETEDGETNVVDRQEVARLDTTLANNETEHHDIEVRPETVGENQRLAVMLYKGEPPEEIALDDAYRSVHLWIDVVEER